MKKFPLLARYLLARAVSDYHNPSTANWSTVVSQLQTYIPFLGLGETRDRKNELCTSLNDELLSDEESRDFDPTEFRPVEFNCRLGSYIAEQGVNHATGQMLLAVRSLVQALTENQPEYKTALAERTAEARRIEQLIKQRERLGFDTVYESEELKRQYAELLALGDTQVVASAKERKFLTPEDVFLGESKTKISFQQAYGKNFFLQHHISVNAPKTEHDYSSQLSRARADLEKKHAIFQHNDEKKRALNKEWENISRALAIGQTGAMPGLELDATVKRSTSTSTTSATTTSAKHAAPSSAPATIYTAPTSPFSKLANYVLYTLVDDHYQINSSSWKGSAEQTRHPSVVNQKIAICESLRKELSSTGVTDPVAFNHRLGIYIRTQGITSETGKMLLAMRSLIQFLAKDSQAYQDALLAEQKQTDEIAATMRARSGRSLDVSYERKKHEAQLLKLIELGDTAVVGEAVAKGYSKDDKEALSAAYKEDYYLTYHHRHKAKQDSFKVHLDNSRQRLTGEHKEFLHRPDKKDALEKEYQALLSAFGLKSDVENNVAPAPANDSTSTPLSRTRASSATSNNTEADGVGHIDSSALQAALDPSAAGVASPGATTANGTTTPKSTTGGSVGTITGALSAAAASSSSSSTSSSSKSTAGPTPPLPPPPALRIPSSDATSSARPAPSQTPAAAAVGAVPTPIARHLSMDEHVSPTATPTAGAGTRMGNG